MTGAYLVVAALVLVPGLGAALALAGPGAIAIETRIALAFGLGYALVSGVAILLVLANLLSRPAFIAAVVLATAAVWVVALKRGSPRAHGAAMVAQAREAPFVLAAGLAFLLAVAVTRPLYPAGTTLAIRSSWRYWADGLEVGANGHVPAKTPQWGTEITPTVSKVVLNAFEGGISFVLGPEPFPAMQSILVVTAIGLAASLLALGRELGLRIFAPLLPALVMLVPKGLPLAHEITKDLKWYTAEDMGRLAALAGLLVGIYAVRTPRDRGAPVVTGLVLVLGGLTHLVPAVIAVVLLALFALAALLVKQAGLRRVLVGGAVTAVAFGCSYVCIVALSGGDLGFQRAEGKSFEGFPPGVDPTRSFVRGKLVPRMEKEGHFLISPRSIARRYAQETTDRHYRTAFVLLGLTALALAAFAVAWFMRALLPPVVMAVGLALTVVSAALLFSFRYDTRIPADFGVRRLFDYAVLVPALLGLVVLEGVASVLARRTRIVVAVCSLAAGMIAVAAAVARVPADRSLSRASAGKAVIEQVAETVPCGARMVVNARTAGTWEATTGRPAVTEGHAPYLRPDVMKRALNVLIAANEFFDDPEANRQFLTRERIQYIVVVKPGIWVGTAGPRRPTEADADAVGSLPDVRAVSQSGRATVFAVGATAAAHARGQPARCPL
jgi:hypothetical protein